MGDRPQHGIAPSIGSSFSEPESQQLAFVSDPYEGFPEDFVVFHRENPHIYSTLRTLALQARDAGARKLGMKQLWEVCRWQLKLDTSRLKPRMNNDFTAYYSRLLMANEPSLDGVFVIRALRRAA